jgi:putative ABC transport system substrate-binding protein
MRRIGVLIGIEESDPEVKARLSGFMQGLRELGWTDGRNVRMDVRAAGSVDQLRMFAKELVDLKSEVILAGTTPATAAVGATFGCIGDHEFVANVLILPSFICD